MTARRSLAPSTAPSTAPSIAPSIAPSTAALRLGERVRDARHARGWSQQRLGQQAGYPAQRVSRIENGTGLADVTVIEALASALQTPPAVLVGWATPSGGLAFSSRCAPHPRAANVTALATRRPAVCPPQSDAPGAEA